MHKDTISSETLKNIQYIFTVHNEVAKVMFLHVCVCPQGGSTWAGIPPEPGTPPEDQVHPPGTRYSRRDQVHPPGTRYTPPHSRRLLLRTVRILLERILVLICFCKNILRLSTDVKKSTRHGCADECLLDPEQYSLTHYDVHL